MNILLFVRTWNKKFYFKLLEEAFEDANIISYSDNNYIADYWTGKFIYRSDFQDKKQSAEYLLAKDDIIQRCRYLRSIEYTKAEKLSLEVWNGVSDIFSKNEFDLVVMPVIDNYCMDIIERISRIRNVPVMSMVQNFIDGYSRFTIRGELIRCTRVVSSEEVDRVKKLLCVDMFKPTFAANKEKRGFTKYKTYYRRVLIEKLYYPLKKICTGDFNNSLYDFSLFSGRKCDYITFNLEDYFVHIDDIELQRDYLYMPLHYTPEATVDYWCDDNTFASYEESVINLINSASNDIRFVIKEHPAMVGWRTKRFYEELRQFNNVILIHPYDNSNKLLEKVDNVLVLTGSVGIEALLRNKRVIALSCNYYSELHPNIHVASELRTDLLRYPIVDYDNNEFIRNLLQGMFIYRFGDGRHMREQLKTYKELIPIVRLWWESNKLDAEKF